MHRLGYAHAMARSSALILALVLTGSASAEVFAPDVFSDAQQHAQTAEPAKSNDLHNARLPSATENTDHTSSSARPSSQWISLPVKAPQQDQPSAPRLRF